MMLQQKDRGEMEIMMHLIMTEIKEDPNVLGRMDRRMERTIDNLVYDKYTYISQLNALKKRQQKVEARLADLKKEDEELYKFVTYLHDKNAQLEEGCKTVRKKEPFRCVDEGRDSQEDDGPQGTQPQGGNKKKKLNKKDTHTHIFYSLLFPLCAL